MWIRNGSGPSATPWEQKEALYLAAFDPRIRATVSSEGGVGLTQSNWEAPWYLGEGDPSARVPPRERPGSRAHRASAFLLIGGNSADGDASWPSIEAATPVWSLTGAADAVGLFNHGKGHAFPAVAQELLVSVARLVPAFGERPRPSRPLRRLARSTNIPTVTSVMANRILQKKRPWI